MRTIWLHLYHDPGSRRKRKTVPPWNHNREFYLEDYIIYRVSGVNEEPPTRQGVTRSTLC